MLFTILIVLIGLVIAALFFAAFFTVSGSVFYGIGQWLSDKVKGVTPEERVRRTFGASAEDIIARRAREAELRALVDNPDDTPEDRKLRQQERTARDERKRYLDSLVDK